MISNDFKIYPNVLLGAEAKIGPYVLIGVPLEPDADCATEIGVAALIRSHTVIYAGNQIGDYFQTGHNVLIREHNQIGHHVSIGSATVIEHHVRIGHRVRIHSQAFIPEYCELGDDCWIGPNVVLTNARYPNRPETKSQIAGVIIGNGAVLGANVTVLPGVKIGAGALIGAGAVVTKDVAENMVCVGSPAKAVRSV